MTSEIAGLIAYLATVLVWWFSFLFDRSQGWSAGWEKFKSDFLKYGWPVLKMCGLMAGVWVLFFGLLMAWA
ncbi:MULTISPECIES: hypothetical protein [Serratia]|uniref:hypothetical protein n=1 Tax=Serratia TaxID=613 RepID=UPI000930E947|nr:hypothetical protein [Serratia marcescens]AVD63705.1 hypothetical protein C4B62_10995 [Serratia marcescens]NGD63846.1 hypothetical protein [Serratia marcescens]